MSVDPITSFLAGGLAGAAGTTVTCPLEVVKTRLQSSVGQGALQKVQMYRVLPGTVAFQATVTINTAAPLIYAKQLLQNEGVTALFKGLAPSLLGIIPTRAIYFTTYSQAKQMYNKVFPYESPLVHLCSAVSAGVVTTTCTSPIWVMKTQMQLDSDRQKLTAHRCAKQIYRVDGFRGFYRGLTASYAGLTETAIHFVIYEHFKKLIRARSETNTLELKECILAAGLAKLTASSMCYPHEVCRTRMRQAVSRTDRTYHSFFQTLAKVWADEGMHGLYGGMTPHLFRVVPNTAIVFFTYEAIINMIDDQEDV